MKRSITFKKALAVAFGGHVLVGALMGISVLFKDKSESVSNAVDVIAQDDHIETHRVKSNMATEAEISKQIDAYKKLVESNASKELASQKKIDDLERQESLMKKRIANAKSQLSTVEKKVKATNEELEKVRKQKDEEAKVLAKKLEAEQREAELSQKQLLKEQEVAKAKAARLEEVRQGNTKLLQEVKENNRALEKAQLAKARGFYERSIHDTLIQNWTLPFMRRNVNCRVELSLSKEGVIKSFKIHKPCDQLYHKSIVAAIEKTAFLPRVNDAVFKNSEVVNFIDNSNGVYIR